MGNSGRGIRRSLNFIFAGLLVCTVFGPSSSDAQTRRAFLVGVQHYTDKKVPSLDLTINDANDLAKDLEEVGFDKKNIKVVNDIKTKDGFDKEFSAFLKTVEPDDTVVFFFSGHGFGIEATKTNYLLLADLKSPFSYAKSQIPEKDRKNDDVVRLRIPSYVEAYQQNEVPMSGVSANEIENRLAERKPKSVIMILDACRSIMSADPSAGTTSNDPKTSLRRGNDSGSRLVTDHMPPEGFVIMYSASFGEQALEKLPGSDKSRNSVFTSVLRAELQRPGQSLTELGARVKLVVRMAANNAGRQQEPDFVGASKESDEFYFVGTIGRERFQMALGKCDGADDDWDQIKTLRKRDLYERHRRRFDTCRTGDLARRALIQLQLTADDPTDGAATVSNRQVNECDKLAAAENDRARPPEVAGVLLDKVQADEAIDACHKAAAENPRVARFQYNLGRAYQKKATDPGISEQELLTALREAHVNLEQAGKRGYVSALTNLAVLYEYAIEIDRLGVLAEAGGPIAFQQAATRQDTVQKEAIDLFKRAAQQGHPLAMYILALHYREGETLRRDINQAAELLARSAENGFVSAMVEHGLDLTMGRGVLRSPRRGIEWLQRAAEAGSNRAKYFLGLTYLTGRIAYDRLGEEDSANTVRPDPGLALLWLGRVGEAKDEPAALAKLATLMEDGQGLPNPQPEIAERYWRLAAHGGYASAQAEFADRLRRGLILVKQEYGPQEAITLLHRAISQGSPQAALALAQIIRTGELSVNPDAIEAMRLAYKTIDLAVQTDPTTEEGNPFHEIAAAHLLVEMAKSGEAVDAAGRPLLTETEVARLERFYGSVDPATKRVKVRRLVVPLFCGSVGTDGYGWRLWRFIWVWDWGRTESPTEAQFRNLERTTNCTNNQLLRKTLIDVFEQSKKSNVAYADLIEQKIKTADASFRVNEPESSGRRRRRH